VFNEEKTVATRRTYFETAMVWLKSFLLDNASSRPGPPTCFISYAWGAADTEKWAHDLARDLQNGGISVVFDRWHNIPGSSIAKFIDKISQVDFVVAIGSPEYLRKYVDATSDSVVEAELRLIETRLRKRATERQRVIPLLLTGNQATSFPPQFEDSVYVDCRAESQYFAKLFDLFLTLYTIPFDHPKVEEFRDAFRAAAA
jgi:hypothetical protein